MNPTSRRLVTLLVAVTGACLVLRYVPFQMDDAFITYRYAVNLVEHGEIAFNHGGPRVEGFTSPLWLALLTPWALFGGVDLLPLGATILGFGAWLLLVVLTWRLGAPSHSTSDADQFSLTSIALVALSPDLGFHAVAGMEELLFVGAVLGVSGAAAGRIPLGWGAAAAFLATWIRPEGAVLPLCAAAVALALAGRRGALSRPPLAILVAWSVGFALLLAARFTLFGALLPNTFFAKEPSVSDGARYLVDCVSNPATGGLAALGVVGCVIGSRWHRIWGGLGLFWAAIAVIEGGDWMPHARLLLPALACFALAAGGIDAVAFGGSNLTPAAGRRARLALRTGIALVLAASALQGLMTAWRVERTEQRWRVELAALLDWTSASGARSIGLVDIGRVGFYSRLELFDFGGLVDAVVARSPGGLLRKQFDLDYLFEQRRPDLLLFRFRSPPEGVTAGAPRIEIADAGSEVEARILADPRLSTRYRPAVLLLPSWEPDRYRDRYSCRLIFVRRDEPRQPDLDGKPLAVPDGELQILSIPDPLASASVELAPGLSST